MTLLGAAHGYIWSSFGKKWFLMKIIVYCGNRSQEIDTASIGFNDEGWKEASDEFREGCIYDWMACSGWFEPFGWHYPLKATDDM